VFDKLDSSSSTSFSSSTTGSLNSATPQRYASLIEQEINDRVKANKRLEELDDNDDAEIASEKGKEALRRLLWAKEIAELFPEECTRDFA
jgi:hypothetical protein